MAVLCRLHRARDPQAWLRTSMATSGSGWRAHRSAQRIRIHPEEHETLVGRRTRIRPPDANERLNQFGEEHARTRARKRARNDEQRTARPDLQDGRRGEEPILEHHRGASRPVASARGTGRAHASRTARRSKGRQEGRCQEGRLQGDRGHPGCSARTGCRTHAHRRRRGTRCRAHRVVAPGDRCTRGRSGPRGCCRPAGRRGARPGIGSGSLARTAHGTDADTAACCVPGANADAGPGRCTRAARSRGTICTAGRTGRRATQDRQHPTGAHRGGATQFCGRSPASAHGTATAGIGSLGSAFVGAPPGCWPAPWRHASSGSTQPPGRCSTRRTRCTHGIGSSRVVVGPGHPPAARRPAPCVGIGQAHPAAPRQRPAARLHQCTSRIRPADRWPQWPPSRWSRRPAPRRIRRTSWWSRWLRRTSWRTRWTRWSWRRTSRWSRWRRPWRRRSSSRWWRSPSQRSTSCTAQEEPCTSAS
jgi:hypothetical protein